MNRILLAVAVALVGWYAAGASASAAAGCSAFDLKATFAVVPDSQGAGNIVYRLRLTNGSGRVCTITGFPKLTLLGTGRRKLPTHVQADRAGALKPARLTLAPKASASATARFSPDVPGPGETQLGACEPTAHSLRIAPSGGGLLEVPIRPARPVCEHGTLNVTALAR